MRKHVIGAAVGALALVGTALVGGSAMAKGTGGTPFDLALSGANEFNAQGVPSNEHGDADRGSVHLTLNQGQGRVCWTFGALTLTSEDGLPTAAHIHQAPAGIAGPVVVPLFSAGGEPPAPAAYPTGTTCVSAPKALVKDIRQNPDAYYVNLHNDRHPGGVMRAQLSD